MAGTDGQTPDPLMEVMEALAEHPFAFDFFQAARRVQAQFAHQPRIGYSLSPSQDPIRFAQKPSLAFAPSTLDRLEPGPTPSIPRICVHFFGLFGPNGPLPLHLTEYARERELHHGDRTFAAFANVFHHRLISLFFRAWADNHKALDLDRPDDQRFAEYFGSLFGIGMDSLRDRDAVPDRAKLYYAGRLASQVRNAEGLEAILGDYFGVPTTIQPLVGRWMKLPEDSCCRLGASPTAGRLGLNALVGSRFWECQLNFRIKMGPMKLADFERMLPSGPAFQRLRCWVLNYVGEEFFWDVQMILARKEVPPVQLGRAGRLGWTTWLKTKPFAQDAADLVLIPPGNGLRY